MWIGILVVVCGCTPEGVGSLDAAAIQKQAADAGLPDPLAPPQLPGATKSKKTGTKAAPAPRR